MYSSDRNDQNRWLSMACGYLLGAVFTALFGAIYELFSHEVYSYAMIYAFAFPLVGGTLPALFLTLHQRHYPFPQTVLFHFCGITTLTMGSIMKGILDIYGTSNALTTIYWIVGVLFMICAAGYEMFTSRERKK